MHMQRPTMAILGFDSDFHDADHLAERQMLANEALVRKIFDQMDEADTLHSQVAYQDRIREDERKRIARELHDSLGQNLLALRLEVASLHNQAGQRHPRLHARAEVMLDTIDATIRSVRSIISDLRPFELELGLMAAIEWQLARFRRLSGIACSLHLESPPEAFDLGDAHTLTVFRVLQEALSNVVRHACATHAAITLRRSGSILSLDIADDGVGMDQDAPRSTTYGLTSIRERLAFLGGRLDIIQPGRGTVLRVTLPV